MRAPSRCGRCGRQRPIRSRGLCAPCYSYLWARHRPELEHYPPLPHPPGRRDERVPYRGRLGAATVRAIRGDSRPQAAIAAEYGIAQTTVSAIKRRVFYRRIPDDPPDTPRP